jgi:ABC-type nitrate/sulfonate/bicarbonate transport system ATPase subunit
MPPNADATFALEAVGYSYTQGGQSFEAVKDVSLHVRPREFVSIIGPSGCGKSTLLKIACGLLEPSSGGVKLGNKTAHPLGQVGYMPQADLLLPWRTVLDNTLLGLEIAGRPRAAARSEAQQHLAAFGLEQFAARYPSELSEGMRQRAALLRTLLLPRPIHVLDEPFGKLDSLTRLAMHRWLHEVWEHSGASILFVTHDLDEALLLSDRIYVMGGRPGTIRREVSIERLRPRDPEVLLLDREIAEEKVTLLRLLSPKSAGTEEAEDGQ